MQEITTVKELKAAIRQLESDQKIQGEQLKVHFVLAKESMKPANLIQHALVSLMQSPWVMIIGIDTIKSVVHRIIDKIWPAGKPGDPPVS
jgi:hypothetical protein